MNQRNTQADFWDNVKRKLDDECWDWKKPGHNGYGSMFQYRGKRYYPHVLAYIFTHPEEDITGKEIMHSCDNPLCCNSHHLKSGTHQENMKDKVNKGRCRLNIYIPSYVKEIRELYATKQYTQFELAKRYNINLVTCNQIINNRRYKENEYERMIEVPKDTSIQTTFF